MNTAISKLTKLDKARQTEGISLKPAKGSGAVANFVNTVDSDEDDDTEDDPEYIARVTKAIKVVECLGGHSQ